MNLMICLRGGSELVPFLPAIAELGAGIELQSYGMVGVQSERDWEDCFARHMAVRKEFQGTIAIHGPFVGMDYTALDYLIRGAVMRRLDMTFEAASKLRASRVVLHGGCKPEIELFNLWDAWIKGAVEFWKHEIGRWADASIEIVLENETEKSPDYLVRLVSEVDNPFFGLCLDTGHQHLFSDLGAVEWVRRMDGRLSHVHLHDNDGSGDKHWSIGRGTIDFEPFYAALAQHGPKATISLEVEDTMEAKMGDMRKLAARFVSR